MKSEKIELNLRERVTRKLTTSLSLTCKESSLIDNRAKRCFFEVCFAPKLNLNSIVS